MQGEPDTICQSCALPNSGGDLPGGEEQHGPGDPEAAGQAGISRLCPRCLRLNEPGSHYCYYCGLQLTDEVIRAGRRAARAFRHGAPGGFWIRAVALAVDIAVLAIFVILIFVAFGARTEGFFGEDTSGTVFASLVSAAVLAVYSPALITLWGTTVGKRVFDLHVLRRDGMRCGFWQAFGRQVASIVSILVVGIGYLMIAFRADKRGLHDLMAGTAVIRR